MMKIREETTDDHADVRSLVTDAFGQLDKANLVDALRSDGDSIISLVAEDQGEICVPFPS